MRREGWGRRLCIGGFVGGLHIEDRQGATVSVIVMDTTVSLFFGISDFNEFKDDSNESISF